MWLTKFKNYSIKRQLAFSLYLGVLALSVLLLAGTYYTIQHEVDEVYDSELSQLARVLLTLYASDDIEARARKNGTIVTAPPFEGDENYENMLLFQIWGNNQTLLVRSSNAPETPIEPNFDIENLNQFNTRKLFGSPTRIYTLWIPQVPFVVHIGQKMDIRTEITHEILESFYILVLLLLPALLFIINRSINRGLSSLNQIAGEITERTSDNLEPVNLANVPAEIKGITASLNHLFERLKSSFTRERQFIADASHELRTPLAGLKAQAQLGLMDRSRVEKSLHRIVEGVDRTSRIANQLLALSRLDSDKVQLKNDNVLINDIVNDVCFDLSDVIKQKNLQITKHIELPLSCRGDYEMLYVLIRNLFDNAIRYSYEDSEIVVQTHTSPNPMLTISDNGPGIPQDSIGRVFDRFYRDIDTTETGSGLGLAIVKRIANLHNIKLTLENRAKTTGVNVELIFDALPK